VVTISFQKERAIKQTFSRKLSKLTTDFQHLSQKKLEEKSRVSLFFYHPLYLLVESIKKFKEDDCLLRASALAYQSVFSMVPILVLSFSIFTAVPQLGSARGKVERFLYSHLLPNSGESINSYISSFSENAKTVGIVGFFGFIIIFVVLLENIEHCFNEIWMIPLKRSFFEKLISITIMTIWGPLLIGLSIYVNNRVSAFLLKEGINPSFLDYLSVSLLPFFITFLAFSFLYYYLPFTKVSLRASLIGGLVTNILWTLSKYCFSYYTEVVSFKTLYGSLSLLPLLLLWIFLTWIIILFGTEVSFIVQHASIIKNKKIHSLDSCPFYCAIQLMENICYTFLKELSPPDLKSSSKKIGISENTIADFVQKLVECHLITISQSGHLVPAKNPENITLRHVKNAIIPDFFLLPKSKDHHALFALLNAPFQEIQDGRDVVLDQINFKMIVDKVYENPEASNTS